MNVLVVETDPTVRERVRQALASEAFTILTARSRAEALAVARVSAPDLVLIGSVRWDTAQRDLCVVPPQRRRVSVVALSPSLSHRHAAHTTAADAILPPHFSARELAECVRRLLRGASTPPGDGAVLRLGSLTLDLASRTAAIAGVAIPLRAKEFGLLVALAQHVGETLRRDQLLQMAWGYDVAGVTRTVDVHVQHVRRKLSGSGVRIETQRGVGYRLELDDAPSLQPTATMPASRAHDQPRSPSRKPVSAVK